VRLEPLLLLLLLQEVLLLRGQLHGRALQELGAHEGLVATH
jgi:hypothetical protein